MRLLPSGISFGTAATLALTTLCFLVDDVLGRPSPEPKSAWVRNKSHGRKVLSDILRGKRDLQRSVVRSWNESATCAELSATAVTAPKDNLWSELDDTDAAAIVAWLFAQPEFNLTVSDNATEWDNTV